MKNSNLTSLLLILTFGFISINISAQDCLNFNNMTDTPANYNNDSIYPIGSVFLNSGDLNLIKTKTGAWGPGYFEQSTISSYDSTNIWFHGYLTFDVSNSPYPCKELAINGTAEKIIIGNDTVSTAPGFNPYNGSGYVIDTLQGGGYVVTGSFNAVTIWIPTGILYSACMQNCTSSATTCIIADDLNPSKINYSPGGYNDDNAYPAGSILTSQNNINIIKTLDYNNGFTPNTNLSGVSGGKLLYWGGLTFDVSASTFTCKKLTIRASGGGNTTIYADNDTMLTRSGYTVTQIAFDHYVVEGNFNTVTFIDHSTSMFESACLEDCSLNNSGCNDLNSTTFTDTPANYNNDSIYPIGSPFITLGDIQIIKPKTGAWMPNFDQSTINQVNANDILYHGYITFDVSTSNFACKELIIIGFASEIIIGTDTVGTGPGFNPYNGNGFVIDTVSGGYKISGSFNSATLFAPTSIYSSVCLNDCSINNSSCIDFNDTNLVVSNIATNDTTFNSVDYSAQGIDFSVKYEDHTGVFPAMQGSYQIKDSTGGWSHIFDMHPNFGGSMWWLGNVAVLIDLNNIAIANKKVTFDISNQGTNSLFLLQNPFRVNGMNENTLPAGVTYIYNYVGLAANGDSSYQVEINGPITTLQWYGFEVGFDNLCVDSLIAPPPPSSACIDFQDTTLTSSIPSSQTSYGSPWYTKNGVSFVSKYFDYTSMGLPGDVHINDHVTAGYTGANGSSNYVGNIFYQGNVITQVDFSSLAINPKQIEFDVNYISNSGSANPYYVNGNPLNSLPAGVTYTATPLTHGYHITLTGNINTIEVHGFEVGVDNLCVDSATTPCSNYAGFTFVVTSNGVQFTNTSSSTATSANQFQWDFGDGNYSNDNDPLHNYTSPGTYYVCLTIVDFSCPTNPTFQFCDSVIIGACPNGHRIITPNNDGQADEVFIPKGSKIYDRNGFMVREVKQDMNWKGRNDSNQPLPMGYYTVTCGKGEGVFNITIVK